MTHHVREVAVRYTRRKLKVPDPSLGTPLSAPAQVAATFAPLLANEPREVLVVCHLDARNQLLRYEVCSKGTVSSALASPRELIISGLLSNAAALIMLHNHPSGNPSPSPEDNDITRRVGAVCELVNLPLVDHVIVGSGRRYFSYLEAGRLGK